MPRGPFLAHADVVIDPAVPVPDRGLPERGLERHPAFSASAAVDGVGAVWSSGERKAREGATTLSEAVGITPRIHEGLGENDRSATGHLPGPEFERTAARFLAEPDTSARGWEPAADARARVAGAVAEIPGGEEAPGDVAIVAHGGVGALLLCHLMGAPIDRAHDQPGAGGGYWSAFDRDRRARLHGRRATCGRGALTPGGRPASRSACRA